ncbi:MAG: cadherin domain-containing protein [Chloroflexi bacterium]|nr:cadherin domain-containing protein [Chloroflexota bacterium]
MEEVLEKGLRLAESSPVHLAFRGTASTDSIRCGWRGVARTVTQREEAIRFWLGLEASVALPPPAELEQIFMEVLEDLDPLHPESTRASFRALARGGISKDYLFLSCYVDYTVSEYLLGAGPGSLTVVYDRLGESMSYELYARAHVVGEFGDGALGSPAQFALANDLMVWGAEQRLAAVLGGREAVVFVAPLGAHNAIAVEAWLAVDQWDLQTDDDDVVQAVRYGTPEGDPEHTQALAALRTRITTAAAGDAHATTRIVNASGLRAYYRTIGAYGDITPGDGETTTFTPAQPPPALTCAGGTAVSTPDENRALVHDCEVLLDHKAALAGTATLNWSTTTAIASWDGVTTGGTPLRVTGLALASESLGGTIPAALGGLSGLTTLNLSSNSLTGSIPAELGMLYQLTTLRLSGNSLTGCIPVALKDVATNDLSLLSLLYCSPPSPAAPTAATAAEGSVALSWSAVTGASAYRVEYRLDRDEGWTEDSATVTGTTHTVDGLHCEDTYVFRVSAQGSGTTYATGWSAPSVALRTATNDCTHPVFGAGSYAFTVFDDAAAGDTVGSVTATDAAGDTLTYAISGGNEAGAFAIDGATGVITVAAALDHEVTPTYTLTVTVQDAPGGFASVDVTITVTEPPPCRTPTAADCIQAVYAGAPADYTEVSEIPASALLEPASDGRYDVQRGQQYTVVTSSSVPEGYTRLSLVLKPLGQPSPVSASQLIAPLGTTYTFTPTANTAGANLFTYEQPAARPFARPRPDNKPELGPVVVTTGFRVVPPAPANPGATLADGAFTLTWDAVTGADRYRVRYRADVEGAWTDLSDGVATDTSATLTPAALSCGERYEFEVEAHGDGSAYAAAWGATATVRAETEACPPPVFGSPGYAFSLVDDAAAGAVVGQVEARSADGDRAVSYAITAGNTGSAFAIGTASGEITVAGALSHGTTPTYSLTVTATDSGGGSSATASVTVRVTPNCSGGTVVANPGDNPGLVGDCELLLAVKDTLRGAAPLGWSTDTAISSWEGVTVSGEPSRVTGLVLTYHSLTGTIPARLGELTALTSLQLAGNSLTGSIPAELGSLAGLQVLYLDNNRLTGSIPPALGNLPDLWALGLNGNRLTGVIPDSFATLWALRYLYLDRNRLSGAIPAVLGDLNLRWLSLGRNAFTGCIPAALGEGPASDVSSLGLSDCAAEPTHTLTTSAGAGGSIEPGAGTHTYRSGALVRVLAKPNSTFRVASWSGACAGTPATETACILTMGADQAAGVTFERDTP